MRVAILPTGRTEWHGLPQALSRLFPDHEFYSIPTRDEIYSYPKRFPYDGFTSRDLTEQDLAAPPGNALRLVARAAQEALGDRHADAAELVVIFDDVELVNVGQESRIMAVMHAAVIQHLEKLSSPIVREKTQAALREKVSFHIAKPMIEGWFFADRHALSVAGVPPALQPRLLAGNDPEAFETDDPDYLAADEGCCPGWQGLPNSRRGKLKPKWLGASNRERHPKGYLQWLCRSADAPNCTCYSESEGGGRALADIDWPSLLNRNPAHFSYLRALIEDLAHGLGCQPNFQSAPPLPQTASVLGIQVRDPVLRNL